MVEVKPRRQRRGTVAIGGDDGGRAAVAQELTHERESLGGFGLHS